MPFASLEVKLQVPGVASNPLPLIVPRPVIFRKVELCETITHDVRSNLNPPTLHRFGVLVEGLKIQGAAIVTVVPGEMLEKSPESCSTNELFQRLTLVAVANEVVSKVTVPAKSMLPWIGIAPTDGAKLPKAAMIENAAIASLFMLRRGADVSRKTFRARQSRC